MLCIWFELLMKQEFGGVKIWSVDGGEKLDARGWRKRGRTRKEEIGWRRREEETRKEEIKRREDGGE